MRKRLWKRVGIGFLLGVAVGTLIAWLTGSSRGSLISPAQVARVGSETGAILLHLLVSGLLGAFAMGGTLFYEIERWSLARSTAAHCLLIVVPFAAGAWLLRWADSPADLLIMTGMQTAAFFVVWIIMCLRCKAQVRELNELLKESREDAENLSEKK